MLCGINTELQGLVLELITLSELFCNSSLPAKIWPLVIQAALFMSWHGPLTHRRLNPDARGSSVKGESLHHCWPTPEGLQCCTLQGSHTMGQRGKRCSGFPLLQPWGRLQHHHSLSTSLLMTVLCFVTSHAATNSLPQASCCQLVA